MTPTIILNNPVYIYIYVNSVSFFAPNSFNTAHFTNAHALKQSWPIKTNHVSTTSYFFASLNDSVKYRGADKSLARPGRKQARKHVRDARDFNNIETRAVIKLFPMQGNTPKEIHAILIEILTYFLPGRVKNLSAPLYKGVWRQGHEE